jgi:hypothetical protein
MTKFFASVRNRITWWPEDLCRGSWEDYRALATSVSLPATRWACLNNIFSLTNETRAARNRNKMARFVRSSSGWASIPTECSSGYKNWSSSSPKNGAQRRNKERAREREGDSGRHHGTSPASVIGACDLVGKLRRVTQGRIVLSSKE